MLANCQLFLSTLRELHWLSGSWLAFLTFKAVHTETHLTSLIFLFITVLPVFLGHLPPVTCLSH